MTGGKPTKACDLITFFSHPSCQSDSLTVELTDGCVARKTPATMLEFLYEASGEDRCLFGSDYPEAMARPISPK